MEICYLCKLKIGKSKDATICFIIRNYAMECGKSC